MKISVQFEADSADDYDRIIAALSGPGRSMFHVKQLSADEIGLAREDAIIQSKKSRLKFETQQEPSPVQPQAALEPESPQIEPSEAEKPAEKPVEAKKRGRPFKAVPIEEAPVEAPKPAPVVAKTNGGPVISRQDLLDVFAEYVQRYSANYGYTDISNLLQQNFGGAVRKASDVLEEQLPAAVAAIKAAIIDNPFNRKRDYA